VIRLSVALALLLTGCVDKAERCEQLYKDDLVARALAEAHASSGTKTTREPLSPKEVKWYEANCWDGKPRTR
jgi:hypothetical protein